MIKKALLCCLFASLMAGCGKNDEETIDTTPKLKNSHVSYLILRNNLEEFFSEEPLGFPFDSAGQFCTYSYLGNSIHRVQGGLINIWFNKFFTNEYAYDSIAYGLNYCAVYSKKLNPNGGNKEDNDTTYYYFNNSRLIRLENTAGAWISAWNHFDYHYSGNMIYEINQNGDTARRFELSGGNLKSVTLIQKSWQSNIRWIYEFHFSNYDTHPNPFEAKWFVLGAFYRAFSKNNYNTLVARKTWYDAEGNAHVVYQSTCTIPFSYTPAGYPAFGEYY